VKCTKFISFQYDQRLVYDILLKLACSSGPKYNSFDSFHGKYDKFMNINSTQAINYPEISKAPIGKTEVEELEAS